MATNQFRAPQTLVFDQNVADNWNRFIKAFNIYMKATQYEEKEDEIKIAIFLNVAGEEALNVFETLKLGPQEKTVYKSVIDSFKKHCEPTNNETYNRFKFFKRIQAEGEEFEHFLVEIKTLARQCNFGMLEESLIRDKIVMNTG